MWFCPELCQFSGARVVRINGEDPFFAVNANAKTTGYFQGLASRQNASVRLWLLYVLKLTCLALSSCFIMMTFRFFSSSVRRPDGWSYILGEFAEKVHPTVDSVQLTIKRVGSDIEETITVSLGPRSWPPVP